MSSSSTSGRTQRDRVRPDPVSCQSCRSKKLKCNRVQPCSNCVVRGIICNFLVPPQVQTPEPTSAEIVRRLERLESVVLNQTDSAELYPGHTLDHSNVTMQNSRYSSPESVAVSNVYRKRDSESRFLENTGTWAGSFRSRSSKTLAFRISSTDEILKTSEDDLPNDTVLTFPACGTATQLLWSYESNVESTLRITHTPTLRSRTRSFYLRTTENGYVLPGEAALLLSVFAIAAFFYQPFDQSEVATTKSDALLLSKILSKDALDALDYSRRNTSGTLEDVQAYILISYINYNNDGLTAERRRNLASAFAVARELHLHRLDANNGSSDVESETSVDSLIDYEVKRRVFWHLTSIDWSMSTVSGSQEGTYLIHPSQVKVNFPRDCTDDDLALGGQHLRSLKPTGRTFLLERIQFAHLCREMTDLLLERASYDQIIAFDKKLQDFISSLPFYFQPDHEDRGRKVLDIPRYCIITSVQSRRYKLHQRFLLRQSVDSYYAYSRRACVEEARAVVKGYEDLRKYELSIGPQVVDYSAYSLFFSILPKTMDLCFRRDGEGVTEKTDAQGGLQMYGGVHNTSSLLSQFLDSVSKVLQKHKVHIAGQPISGTENIAGYTSETMADTSHNSVEDIEMQSNQFGFSTQNQDLNFDNSFEDFLQNTMLTEPNHDSLSWDTLFSPPPPDSRL